MRFPVVLVLVALLAQLSVYDGIERKKDTVGVEEDIYAWGFNEYGQLGLGDGLLNEDPRYANEPEDQPRHYLLPQLIKSITNVDKVFAGGYHVLATIDGQLYSWGWNAYGQLGRLENKQTYGRPPREAQDNLPRRIDALKHELFDLVAAGVYHNIAVSRSGNVYAFGRNHIGQLGVGNFDDQHTPTLVKTSTGQPFASPVSAVFCGADHTFVVLHNYEVYGTGSNKFGQLALSKARANDNNNHFVFIPSLSALKLVRIFIGPYHAIGVAETGEVYSWGYNGMAGIFGCGDNSIGQLATGDLVSQRLPVQANVSSANGGRFRVYVGGYHVIAVTEDRMLSRGQGGSRDKIQAGRVYAWGSNEFGQLGIGVLGTNFYDKSKYEEGENESDAVPVASLVATLYGFNISEVYPGQASTYAKLGTCPWQNIDACGVCMGDNTTCYGCDGIPGSNVVFDACGVCGGDGSSCTGCDGVPFSGLKVDGCGICGGNGTSCVDCNGVLYGSAQLDLCGICNGDNSTCKGCDGIPNSGKVFDRCEICGGLDSSCLSELDVPFPTTVCCLTPCQLFCES